MEQGIWYVSMARGLDSRRHQSWGRVVSWFTWMTLEFRRRSNRREPPSETKAEKDNGGSGGKRAKLKRVGGGVKIGSYTEHRASVENAVLRREDRGLTEHLSPQTLIDCDSRIVSPSLSMLLYHTPVFLTPATSLSLLFVFVSPFRSGDVCFVFLFFYFFFSGIFLHLHQICTYSNQYEIEATNRTNETNSITSLG